jgi:ABC-type sugar transport system permease subunit
MLFMREGLVNRLLSVVSVPGQDWLGDVRFSLATISLLSVWQFGSSMVLFLAGLKQVPEQLVEAARIDGAGPVRIFFRVTFPLITPSSSSTSSCRRSTRSRLSPRPSSSPEAGRSTRPTCTP